jgi:hypothetical protein
MEDWTRAFAQLQQPTKQKLTGLDQMQVGRVLQLAHGPGRRPVYCAARQQRAARCAPAYAQRLKCRRACLSRHSAATTSHICQQTQQLYAQQNPTNREQLSALLDVSGQLLADNNYKVGRWWWC